MNASCPTLWGRTANELSSLFQTWHHVAACVCLIELIMEWVQLCKIELHCGTWILPRCVHNGWNGPLRPPALKFRQQWIPCNFHLLGGPCTCHVRPKLRRLRHKHALMPHVVPLSMEIGCHTNHVPTLTRRLVEPMLTASTAAAHRNSIRCRCPLTVAEPLNGDSDVFCSQGLG